jgi:hypothetical protein
MKMRRRRLPRSKPSLTPMLWKKDFLNGEITQLEGTGAKHELD